MLYTPLPKTKLVQYMEVGNFNYVSLALFSPHESSFGMYMREINNLFKKFLSNTFHSCKICMVKFALDQWTVVIKHYYNYHVYSHTLWGSEFGQQ